MPIYEFRCESCQKVFEHLALTSQEGQPLACPACGGAQLSRVLSACASVVTSPPSPAAGANPSLQSRSCQNAGSCSTLTLPGYSR